MGRVLIYVDGSAKAQLTAVPFTYVWDTSSYAPGQHSIQVRAYDTCGNSTNSAVTWVNLVPLLRLYIDQPAYGGTTSGTSAPISGWATASASVRSLAFVLDGATLPLSSPYIYGTSRADVCSTYPGDPNCPRVGFVASFDSTRYPNGSHTLAVTATDASGLQGTAAWPIAISNAVAAHPAPTGAISSPAGGAIIRGALPVTSVVTPAVGATITKVEIYIDSSLKASFAPPQYSWVWATTGYSDGTHSVMIKAYDSFGQSGTAAATVTIDNASPSFFVSQPTAGGIVSGTSYKVAGWATDASGVATIALSVDGQQVPTIGGVSWLVRADVCASVPTGDPNCPNVGWRTFFDSTRYSMGAHSFAVTITDAAGNSASTTISVTVAN